MGDHDNGGEDEDDDDVTSHLFWEAFPGSSKDVSSALPWSPEHPPTVTLTVIVSSLSLPISIP